MMHLLYNGVAFYIVNTRVGKSKLWQRGWSAKVADLVMNKTVFFKRFSGIFIQVGYLYDRPKQHS